MPDLFGGSLPAARKRSDKAAAAPGGRFVKDAGGAHFVHDCGLCGAANAPFGYGVRLRQAYEKHDVQLAGRWLCAPCRDRHGDL